MAEVPYTPPEAAQRMHNEPIVTLVRDIREHIAAKPAIEASDSQIASQEKQSQPYFPVMIVLGKNWKPELGMKNGHPAIIKQQASIESQMGAAAAYTALRKGWTDKVIFTGGETGGPQSEAREMKDLVLAMCESDEEIAQMESKILTEDHSKDTVANAENVALELQRLGIDPAECLVATVGFHKQRAGTILRQHLQSATGKAITEIPTEVLFRTSINPKYMEDPDNKVDPMFAQFFGRAAYGAEMWRELISRLIPSKFTKWLAERFRK